MRLEVVCQWVIQDSKVQTSPRPSLTHFRLSSRLILLPLKSQASSMERKLIKFNGSTIIIKDSPPLTLRVAPFFRLVLVFYLFGTAVVMMFLLFDLFGLALASGIFWVIFVLVSIRSIIIPFVRNSRERVWMKR